MMMKAIITVTSDANMKTLHGADCRMPYITKDGETVHYALMAQKAQWAGCYLIQPKKQSPPYPRRLRCGGEARETDCL